MSAVADNGSSSNILKAWRGQAAAFEVFWVFAFPFNLAFFATGFIAGYFATRHPWLSYIVFIAGPLYCLFLVWFCVSLWRCAFNADWAAWGYLSRAWVILLVSEVVYKLLQLAKFLGLS